MFRALSFFAAVAATTATGQAANTEVQRGKAPDWILAPPAPTGTPTPAEAPVRFAYLDQQVRIGAAGEESYTAYRVRLLKPEALQIGNVNVTWNPSSGGAVVHALRIIRDGEVIDVLASNSFRMLQREGGLEQSMLDGLMTANLQIPGLRMGDEIEFAATVTSRDPTLGDHSFGFGQLPMQGAPGSFRYRLLWPEARKLSWRATGDLSQSAPAVAGGQKSLVYELGDPKGVIATEGAPTRYNIRRLVEYSDFTGWRDVSKRVAPLFNDAAHTAAGSPLRAEAAKIAAATRDPLARTEAALRVVQEQIRYVYVGLDGGNYQPAGADETWSRRFGDCKAKTAALLALLRQLGVDAEAVLVNTQGADGIDQRLPSPGMFNHVLVRARIGSMIYWLDGTRLGDLHLDRIPPPPFRWALPLSTAGSDIEAVPTVVPAVPQFIGVIDVDASKGFAQPAKVKAQHVLTDDAGYASRAALAGMSAEDADRAVKAYWRREMDWVEPETVSWRYDNRLATMVFTVSGEGKPDWEGDDKEGRSLDIYGAGFVAPDAMRRPKEQDQEAPWATEFPRFRCWATTIRLPATDKQWRWAYTARPMNLQLGGVRYWRRAGLSDNVVRTVMSRQTYAPEVGATEARELNDNLPAFDNKISRVFQEPVGEPAGAGMRQTFPFADDVDWASNAKACTSAP